MINGKTITELAEARKSIRTYSSKSIPSELMKELEDKIREGEEELQDGERELREELAKARTELEDGIRLAYADFLNNPMRAER